MDWPVAGDVIAKSGRAVEATGSIDTLLIDKTGRIVTHRYLLCEVWGATQEQEVQ